MAKHSDIYSALKDFNGSKPQGRRALPTAPDIELIFDDSRIARAEERYLQSV